MKRVISINEFGLNENCIVNNSTEKKIYSLENQVFFSDIKTKYCKISFRGTGENAGGFIVINKNYPVVAGAIAVMEICTPVYLNVELVVSAESVLMFDELVFEELEDREYLDEQCSENNNVLVIVPDYPSYADLYPCAFAHSRNKEYQKKGLNIQVASIYSSKWYESSYEMDGIPVLQGNYGTLKRMLSSRRYKTIITHFVDENLFSIFEGYVYPTDQMIFICHGAESIYRYVENLVRPYFTKPITTSDFSEVFEKRDMYIKRYAQLKNTEWVFVSEWLRDCAEEQHGLKFLHSRIINNVINGDRFPYVEKHEEDRKKILILRKYDNNMVHSVDQSIRAILELSKRKFFDELTFEIYGDGDYFDVLMDPIKIFKNVHFHRTFIPNHKLHEVHQKAGIALLPSRHDAHAVSMGECASSGLVVVGSRVTSNPYFMQEERFHTLADPEDPIELAGIIERLYYNPKEFLEISQQMSEFTRENFSIEKTVDMEVELIREKLKISEMAANIDKEEIVNAHPLLTVAILAGKNIREMHRCKHFLRNQCNNHRIEIMDVDKGIDGYGENLKKAISVAKGKYFKLIYGEDWVDSEQFSKLIDVLEKEDSDVVLSKGAYETFDKSQLENMVDYDMLPEGVTVAFQDVIYEGYGFSKVGPIFATSVYKTDILKNMDVIKGETKSEFEEEWNAYSVKNIDTLSYYDLDIYRYLVNGSATDKTGELNISNQIFEILQKIFGNDEYSEVKRQYVCKYIISPLVYRQIQLYTDAEKWSPMDIFVKELKQYPEAYMIAEKYIKRKQDRYDVTWKEYKVYLEEQKQMEEMEEKRVEKEIKQKRIEQSKRGRCTRYLKKGIKYALPYGVVRFISRR